MWKMGHFFILVKTKLPDIWKLIRYQIFGLFKGKFDSFAVCILNNEEKVFSIFTPVLTEKNGTLNGFYHIGAQRRWRHVYAIFALHDPILTAGLFNVISLSLISLTGYVIKPANIILRNIINLQFADDLLLCTRKKQQLFFRIQFKKIPVKTNFPCTYHKWHNLFSRIFGALFIFTSNLTICHHIFDGGQSDDLKNINFLC